MSDEGSFRERSFCVAIEGHCAVRERQALYGYPQSHDAPSSSEPGVSAEVLNSRKGSDPLPDPSPDRGFGMRHGMLSTGTRHTLILGQAPTRA